MLISLIRKIELCTNYLFQVALSKKDIKLGTFCLWYNQTRQNKMVKEIKYEVKIKSALKIHNKQELVITYK